MAGRMKMCQWGEWGKHLQLTFGSDRNIQCSLVYPHSNAPVNAGFPSKIEPCEIQKIHKNMCDHKKELIVPSSSSSMDILDFPFFCSVHFLLLLLLYVGFLLPCPLCLHTLRKFPCPFPPLRESILVYPLHSHNPVFISVFLAWLSLWKMFKIRVEAFWFWASSFIFPFIKKKNLLSDFNGNVSVSNNRQQKYSGNIASVLCW